MIFLSEKLFPARNLNQVFYITNANVLHCADEIKSIQNYNVNRSTHINNTHPSLNKSTIKYFTEIKKVGRHNYIITLSGITIALHVDNETCLIGKGEFSI